MDSRELRTPKVKQEAVDQPPNREQQAEPPNRMFAYLKRSMLSVEDQNMPTPLLFRLISTTRTKTLPRNRQEQVHTNSLEGPARTVTMHGQPDGVFDLHEIYPGSFSYDRLTPGGFNNMYEEDRIGRPQLPPDLIRTLERNNAVFVTTCDITTRLPNPNTNIPYETRPDYYRLLQRAAFNRNHGATRGDERTEPAPRRRKDPVSEASADDSDRENVPPHKSSKGGDDGGDMRTSDDGTNHDHADTPGARNESGESMDETSPEEREASLPSNNEEIDVDDPATPGLDAEENEDEDEEEEEEDDEGEKDEDEEDGEERDGGGEEEEEEEEEEYLSSSSLERRHSHGYKRLPGHDAEGRPTRGNKYLHGDLA